MKIWKINLKSHDCNKRSQNDTFKKIIIKTKRHNSVLLNTSPSFYLNFIKHEETIFKTTQLASSYITFLN